MQEKMYHQYKYSFFPHAISLWNELPETIKEIFNHLNLDYNYIVAIIINY